MSLSTTIKSIQDIMRKDVGVDGDAQRIGQLVWLMFLKIWDDREKELELIEDDFVSPLVKVRWQENGDTRVAADLRWRSWASDPEGITGDKLLGFVDKELFPALKGMDAGPSVEGDSEDAQAAHKLWQRRMLVKRVFEDAYQYQKSGTLLRRVINRLEADIDFNDSRNRHVFGDIYETILKGLQSAGNAGEYYTPRPVTQFAVDMVSPKLGETVLDPACGTGGFLACCIESIRDSQVRNAEQEGVLQASIRGIEKKPLPHLLCVTNMIVHGIDVPAGIRRDNTLARPLRDYSSSDRVDVILTNPPFGGQEEKMIVSNFPLALQTTETSLLFLQVVVTLLKPGGRSAIVLPHGVLFLDGVGSRTREMLLRQCNLHTIVRLPEGVFAPYTDIPVNLLFFEKTGPTKEVWFFEMPPPPGARKYTKTNALTDEDFSLVREWWGGEKRHNRKQTDHAWKVSIGALADDGFNLDVRNPSRPDDYTRRPPQQLWQEIKKIEGDINNQLSNLDSLLRQGEELT